MSAEAAQILLDDAECGDLAFDALVAGPDEGTPVLLLHGWPQSARSWDLVVPALAAAGLRCAAVDQRGYSPGARPTERAAYRIDRLVVDAAGFLDALGWESAHVVGHDWGAVVGWVLAAGEPDRVRSLTALSIPHPAALATVAAADEEQRGRLAYMDVLRAEGGVAEQVLLADGGARMRDVFTGDVPDHLVDAHVALLTEPGAMTAALEWYRAMSLQEWADVAEVDVPTTYVWGDRDIAVTRAAAEACGDRVTADYAFVGLAGRGHWLPEQAPDDVAAAVLAQVNRP